MCIRDRARRASGSISSSEALAGVIGQELVRMIAARVVESFAPGIMSPRRHVSAMAMLMAGSGRRRVRHAG
eukprot:2800468-Pyramimonas_sp.AAC.1